jgi:hypothetical protein
VNEEEVIMLAAALIPLMFVVGLFFLVALGAWPIGLGTVVALALLVGFATMLVRYVRDQQPTPNLKAP